jgi:hypothetical protein
MGVRMDEGAKRKSGESQTLAMSWETRKHARSQSIMTSQGLREATV